MGDSSRCTATPSRPQRGATPSVDPNLDDRQMTRKAPVWSENDRTAVREALICCGRRYEQTPATRVDAKTMFAPPAHEIALTLDRPLIIGARGTGKSYWAAALCHAQARERLTSLYPRVGRSLQTSNIFQGFVGQLGAENAPFAATADELLDLAGRAQPDHVWRAVLCRYLANRPDATLAEMYASGATRDRAFRDRIVEIGEETPVLMICDALDRLSTSWRSVRRLCRGVMQLALDLRGFRQANVKVFLRRDQFEDAGLFDFPDASKLRTGAVELDWKHDELYGLLFQGVQAELSEDVWQQQLSPLIPESEDRGSEPYRRAFEHVAGEFMGTNRRRGSTYTWIPKHLSDTSHSASPRSFVVAIGKAAQSTLPDTATPIDYRGIREGVRAASKIRVDELREDHPWIATVLNDLEELTVPCPPEQLMRWWRDRNTARRVRDSSEGSESPGVPIALENGPSETDEHALLDALVTLRIVERHENTNRVNVPDIYRTAARIGRHGAKKGRRRIAEC